MGEDPRSPDEPRDSEPLGSPEPEPELAEEAVARLRAADPAAGAEPDGDRLAALTAQRRGDELAVRRERRPVRWAAVAAVTAGALVVGGASFGLGRASVGDDGGGGTDTALLAEVPAADGLAHAEASWAEPFLSSPSGIGGRTVFTGQGLSGQRGTAEAWAVDGSSVFSAETVERVAEIFGVEGEPRLEGGWNVGPADGDGRTLHVAPDAAVTLMVNDPELHSYIDAQPLPMPVDPAGAAESLAGGGVSGDPGPAPDDVSTPDPALSAAPGPVPPPGTEAPVEPQPAPTTVEPAEPTDEPSAVEPVEPTEPTDEPTAVASVPDGAAGVLHETLTALGLDAEAVEYEVQEEHWAGEEVTGVVGYRLVDGRRTGQAWSADVVDGEVLAFSGPLAPIVPLGSYDVVSPAEAVERLGDPRFGASAGASSPIEIQPYLPEVGGRSWDDPPAAPPQPGSAIPWPVSDVTIVEAEPVLLEQHTADGAMLLLPGYDLGDGEGRTWRVLAVADHELAF